MPQVAASRVYEIISHIDNLPTPPTVYTRINEAISNPNASAYQIASIISEDPAMSAKVLRMSNSAFYGSRAEILSVKQALITIGLEAVKSLVLSNCIFNAFKTQPSLARYQEDFWRHSLAVGSACRLLGRKVSAQWIQNADKLFSTGLLHDIGKLVQISYLADDWKKIEESIDDSVVSTYDLENEIIGYNHAEIGAVLAEKWSLPEIIQDSVAYHHNPGDSTQQESFASIVYLANCLSHYTFDVHDKPELYLDKIDPEVLAHLKFTIDDFENLRTSLIEEYAKSEVFLEIAKGL